MATAALPFKVECKSTYPFFETIAAFNCESPAKWYAAKCSATNPQFEYRVKKGSLLISSYGAIERGVE